MNMLKPEEAQVQLKTFWKVEHLDERVRRLQGLPAKIREGARKLTAIREAHAESSDRDWSVNAKLRTASRKAYRELSPADRKKIIDTICPELAPYIRKALETTGMRISGYGERVPFRTPGDRIAVEKAQNEFIADLFATLGEYPADIEWIATWAAHAFQYERTIDALLAAAIEVDDAKGKRVFDILLESARGEHEIGQMGNHVIRALLISPREDGWKFIEKMLLAAQREEGLRQSVLETIDSAHPLAFPRMLRLILDENLIRFSATIRAMDVWFGFQWDAVSTGKAKEVITTTLSFFEDPAKAVAAIAHAKKLPAPAAPKGKSPKKKTEPDPKVEAAYLALWTQCFNDTAVGIPSAFELLDAPNPEVRFFAALLLTHLTQHETVLAKLMEKLRDPDDRVVALLLQSVPHIPETPAEPPTKNDADEELSIQKDIPGLLDSLEALMTRAPEKPEKLSPIVWPWMKFTWSREEVGAALVNALGDHPPARLIPHIPSLDSYRRSRVIELLGKTKPMTPAARKAILDGLGDSSAEVRREATAAIASITITPAEAQEMESLLSRKAADLRTGVVTVLLSQSDDDALASADRLLASKDALTRSGGIELLRRMRDAERSEKICRDRATAYRDQSKKLTKDELSQLKELIERRGPVVTFNNALGLCDLSKRTLPPKPQHKKIEYTSAAAAALLLALDELVHKHRDESVIGIDYSGEPTEAVLLGNAGWQLNYHNRDENKQETLEQIRERMPLKHILLPWFESRPANLRDADGLELVRASWMLNRLDEELDDDLPKWVAKGFAPLTRHKAKTLKYDATSHLFGWFKAIFPAVNAGDFLLDGLEESLASLTPEQVSETRKCQWSDDLEIVWREESAPQSWLSFVNEYAEKMTSAQKIRFFQLQRWMDEPGAAIPRDRVDLRLMLEVHAAGVASDADLYDQLLGPRDTSGYSHFNDLPSFFTLKKEPWVAKYPKALPIAQRARDRVLEIELARGEGPTIVSGIASDFRHAGGMNVLVPFLAAAENDTFARGHSSGESKAVVFSHIIRATIPREEDTPEAFAQAIEKAGVGEQKLLELALYAPQWVDHVAHVVKWPSIVDATWWLHAHTAEKGWSVDSELRERWQAQIAQRTPLSQDDLEEGAVDVAWFFAIYKDLGKKRWDALYDVAKFASSGGGHKRAQTFADAMLGNLKAKDVTDRINSKRHQDSVRALGLLPLPDGEKGKAEVLSRYQTLQEFIRGSRQFGSQRQTSEKRAAGIGMENLARTSGYPDPIRLQWAMEALACADLAKGPVKVTVGDVTVSLAIVDGEPELTTEKKGKALSSIPPAVKKDKRVEELTERKTDLKRSASRMRKALEQAMVKGDHFSATELRELMQNPLLAPMLERLVFVGDGVLGFPVDGGRGLKNHAGKIEPIKKIEQMRIAHPHDLLASKSWTNWQHDCFSRELVQPFKQVFRELYVVTKTEADTKNQSRRYAGHQVQPRQALALLGGRGWVTAPELGVFRTFHDLGITAWLTFQESFYTPAEIEGLTLESVRFTLRKDNRGENLALTAVPSRVFSEVMRDMDLVVSVAHRGGVDPEASASTIEIREALLKETLALLNIKNVTLKDRHAIIKGELAEYTVHLGSAMTHRQPGGAMFIVAVHSQHRGRIFLPFADDDPRTAEVLSKVILLARDRDIKDPQILAQIRA